MLTLNHLVTSGTFSLDGGTWDVDNNVWVLGDDAEFDLTMAYVGTRKLFEDAGFTKAADTTSVAGGFPRVLMRLDLR